MNDDDKAITKPRNGRRVLLLSLLIGLFLAAGIGYGIYWALIALSLIHISEPTRPY